MGLLKPIMSPIGVPLEYHRITDVMIFTNEQNVINVSSYVNQEQRELEKERLSIEQEKTLRIELGEDLGDLPEENVYNAAYSEGSTFITPYDQHVTVDNAYEYLKTLPEFEGAIDC